MKLKRDRLGNISGQIEKVSSLWKQYLETFLLGKDMDRKRK